MCEPCRTGNGHICEKVDIIGIDIDGCFAQFLVVPEENVWPLHPAIPDKVAAVLDPLGNAMHTVMAPGVSGRSVLITGVGIIGLMAVCIARAAGAGLIMVTDVDKRRLELAKELGADEAYPGTDPNWPAKVRKRTLNQGPQVWLEMSGNPRAIRDGFKILRNGGTVAMLGLASNPVELDLPNDVIFKGAHHPGHQRPAHVRDVVSDGEPAVVRPAAHRPGHHSPDRIGRLRQGLQDDAVGRGDQGGHARAQAVTEPVMSDES